MIERVRKDLERHGLGDRIIEFDTSSATVALAAAALGCDPARIAKSLAVLSGGRPMVIVAAGDARLHNGMFREAFGTRPDMMTPEEAHRHTGYRVGGVCPFALPEGLPVYLDASLARFDRVYPAAGTHNSCVDLSTEELARVLGGAWIRVCRIPEAPESAGASGTAGATGSSGTPGGVSSPASTGPG